MIRDVARWKKILLCIIGGILLLLLLAGSQLFCISGFIRHGISVGTCPDGRVHQTMSLDLRGLRRGAFGEAIVGVDAHYTTEDADASRQTPVRRFDPSLFLVIGEKETALEQRKDWKEWGGARQLGMFKLPSDLADGDYVLRAKVDSPVGESTLDVKLPVYAPAKIHVLTDRPLYEPGNTIKFRAVVLRARNLSPLDGRPGKWVVSDPNGTIVLEERAAAGDYGVVSGDFPLDTEAPEGQWRIAWASGDAKEEVSVRVEPFTLPRFRVEASSIKSFYRAGDRPKLRGKVVYASGAPVRDATLEFSWRSSGAWPPPSSWMQRLLPKRGKVDGSGRFTVELPIVPSDLRGQATLIAAIAATDPAGDRVNAQASILLSEDAIAIQALTDLGGGLVENFNNQLFFRLSSADGTVLRETDVHVKKAWEPKDKGTTLRTDVDGVARMQIDPGPAVNVMVPGMPIRPPPAPARMRRTNAHDLVRERTPSLADLTQLDRFQRGLSGCDRFVNGRGQSVDVTVEVKENGAAGAVLSDDNPLGHCVERGMRGLRMRGGAVRLLRLTYRFNYIGPRITIEDSEGELDERSSAVLEETLRDATRCLPANTGPRVFRKMLLWESTGTKKAPSFRLAVDPTRRGTRASPGIESCVMGKLSKMRWPGPVAEDDEEIADQIGLIRLDIEEGERRRQQKPRPTVMLGYELQATAIAGKEIVGSTKFRLSPGSIPALRLRPNKILAKAGDTLEIKFIRGPDFRGKIPKKLTLRHERKHIESEVDQKERVVRFELPKELTGWFEANALGARTLIYVRSDGELTVDVKSDRPTYRPGDKARIDLATRVGGKGSPAAVGLFGVDQSLAQLVSLPGPAAMAELSPKVPMKAPAFGVLDAEALMLGKVRGDNAAAAIVMQVSNLPPKEAYDRPAAASGSSSFDPIEPLTDHFYGVLGELHSAVRDWEKKAPKSEVMTPERMANLWDDALDKSAGKGLETTDAYGRKLALYRLPEDLLALTDPRAVVIEGTRLPEDVENWPNWVRKERR